MPFADSCVTFKESHNSLSLEFKTRHRSPEVITLTFFTHPLDLQSNP